MTAQGCTTNNNSNPPGSIPIYSMPLCGRVSGVTRGQTGVSKSGWRSFFEIREGVFRGR